MDVPLGGRSRSKSLVIRGTLPIIKEEEVTPYKQAIAQLEKSISEKDDEIKLVAELGKALLEKSQQAEKELQELRSSDSNKSKTIEEYKWRIEELEAKLEEQKELAQRASSSTSHASESSVVDQQLRQLQIRAAELEEQLQETNAQHEKELQELRKKEKQLGFELVDLKAKNERFHERIETDKATISQLNEKEQELRKQITQFEAERNSTQLVLKELEETIKRQQNQLRKQQKDIEAKNIEIQETKDQIEEYFQQTKELNKKHAALEEMVSDLVKRNHSLQQEKEDLAVHLEEVRKTVHSPIASEELAPSPVVQAEQNQTVGSLLSELQESFEKEVMKQKNEEMSPFAGSNLSEHDYFFLCTAAVKIGLLLKHPQKSKDILQVDVQQLFEQAQQEGIPFHEWHGWVSAHYDNLVYNQVSTPEPAAPSNSPSVSPATSAPPSPQPTPITRRERSQSESKPVDEKVKGMKLHQFSELEVKMKTLKLVTNRSGLQEEATLDKDSNLWARTDGQNVLQKLFSDVPDSEIVLKTYPCTLDEIKGQMFITQHRMYFVAVKPFTSPPTVLKLCLHFADLEMIRKPGKLEILKTNVIYVKSKQECRFCFGGFTKKTFDECYEILRKQWLTEDGVMISNSKEDKEISSIFGAIKSNSSQLTNQLLFQIQNLNDKIENMK